MKKIFTTLAMLSVCFALHAQYYYLPFLSAGQNPGNLNMDPEYPVGGGIAAGWTTVKPPSSTPTWSTNQTLPFAFNFNGNPVTSYKVSTTGILTFDVGTALAAPSSTSQALPSAVIPDKSICVWGLVGTGTNDNVVVKTFGAAPNRQYWVSFSSYSVPGNTAGWTYWSIVLEETTNNIYIVDQRTNGTLSMSLGVQIDATTATSVTGSPTITSVSANDPTTVDNAYYQFSFGTQLSYDLYVDDITTPSYVVTGNNAITGVIKNLGSAVITSLTLNYKINGGAVVTDAVTGISIPALGSYNFTHSIPWTSTGPGTNTVECYATDLNGNADQNTANDSYTKTVDVLYSIEQRAPLFEVFTSSTCPPCTPGNQNFHNIVDTINPSDFVYIKYQQDFPGTGDPYTTDESVNRRAFYGINSIPRMENDGGWDGNANSFTYALYEEARSVPAQYKMIGTYTADTVARTYSAKIMYSPLFNATGTNLYTAISERTTHLNVKSNGETEFYQVMKKMLPDENGIAVANIAAGTWDSVTVTYTFNGNYRLPINGQAANVIDNATENSVEEFGDLMMMGWLQSPNGTKQVYQASNFVLDVTAGIYEMSKSINSILFYPNPASDFVNVEISLNTAEQIKMQLMDVQGKTIEVKNNKLNAGVNTVKFDVNKLPAGTYNVAVSDSKNNSFVRRIMVVR
jgi:hypothetical protein